MRVFLTGGASGLGRLILNAMLRDMPDVEIWCGQNRRRITASDRRVQVVSLDLEKDFSLSKVPAPIDLVVHVAGVTHDGDERRYWTVNQEGTRRLTKAARARGCRKFLYVSTRCATDETGSYGASKLAAETELRKHRWKSLVILRPSEVYGGDSREGLNGILAMSRKFHVTPMFFGSDKIKFAPLHVDDFVARVLGVIRRPPKGEAVVELCGPEDLGGVELALRIARACRAVPIPLWWPAFELAVNGMGRLGLNPLSPDQIVRLTGKKTSIAAEADRNRELRPFLKKRLSD